MKINVYYWCCFSYSVIRAYMGKVWYRSVRQTFLSRISTHSLIPKVQTRDAQLQAIKGWYLLSERIYIGVDGPQTFTAVDVFWDIYDTYDNKKWQINTKFYRDNKWQINTKFLRFVQLQTQQMRNKYKVLEICSVTERYTYRKTAQSLSKIAIGTSQSRLCMYVCMYVNTV